MTEKIMQTQSHEDKELFFFDQYRLMKRANIEKDQPVELIERKMVFNQTLLKQKRAVLSST